jgi:hypothetical protein
MLGLFACTAETTGTGETFMKPPATPDLPRPITEHDAGGDAVDTDPITAGERDAAPAGPTDCSLPGTYALAGDLEVSWEGTNLAGFLPVLAAGSGKLRIVTLLELTANAGSAHKQTKDYKASVRACEVVTPDFSSNTAGQFASPTGQPEFYGIAFADQVWEAPGMPRWETRVRAGCGQPGCIMESDSLNALIGLDLDDPTGSWPETRDDARLHFRDDDGDGNPGVTVTTRGPEGTSISGQPYTKPPVDLTLANRATQIMLGVRLETALTGSIQDCEHMDFRGSTTEVNARAITCTYATQTGAQHPCSEPSVFDSGQASFMDGNLPLWSVGAATWKAVRLADGADCAAARSAAR